MEFDPASPFDISSTPVFRKVFLTYYATMCVFAERFIGKIDQVEDIVQAVFLHLLQSDASFEDEEHVKAYLYRAIRHACLDLLKTSQHSLERDTVFYSNQAKSEENFYITEVTRAELLLELKKAIASLPKHLAEIIERSYLEGKSNQEVADSMGLALQTVKNQKRKGLALLRDKLPGDTFTLLLFVSMYSMIKLPFH